MTPDAAEQQASRIHNAATELYAALREVVDANVPLPAKSGLAASAKWHARRAAAFERARAIINKVEGR